ncbi:17-beta-hydroxysteroid dehydrogenase type 2 [Pantherophis guttatus]|uniref:17-beta-hydroxysteroid dehydrogenase type 2 n=1 Tax=Pantherophis guttatus TaxID=94885 RepID=A0A6P9CSX8_PANGU|nr:17-beta-hydroxysteroid dehydrogenase type 2 [Pantherophis guttatus]
MVLYQAELDHSLLFYMGATVLYGGTIFYRAKKNRVEKAPPFLWGLLLLLTLEVLCFTTLRNSLGLGLFSLACLVFWWYTPAQAMLPVSHKAVLITGTDSGIGHELAKYLDSLGFTVFAGVLNATGPGAKTLKETCSERLSILQLDITSSVQIKEAYLETRRKLQNEELWAVINNAGILGYVADGELLPLSSYKQCMDVNFFGPVEISKVFLPLLRKSKGRIINVSSLAGGIPMPLFAAYGASKAALSMFSGVMRQELSKWGIKVALFHPSGFKTSIGGNPEDWKKEEQTIMESLAPDVKKDYGDDYIHNLRTYLSQMNTICSEDLSPIFTDVLHALLAEQPKGLYAPGKNSYTLLLVFCYFPLWFYDFFMSKIICNPHMPYALRMSERKKQVVN